MSIDSRVNSSKQAWCTSRRVCFRTSCNDLRYSERNRNVNDGHIVLLRIDIRVRESDV